MLTTRKIIAILISVLLVVWVSCVIIVVYQRHQLELDRSHQLDEKHMFENCSETDHNFIPRKYSMENCSYYTISGENKNQDAVFIGRHFSIFNKTGL